MAKFEDDLDELEKVVDRLEQGDLALEESVDLYERGVLLSRACKSVLRRVDARIEALVDPEEDGPVRVEDVAMAVAEGEEDEEDDEAFEDSEDDLQQQQREDEEEG